MAKSKTSLTSTKSQQAIVLMPPALRKAYTTYCGIANEVATGVLTAYRAVGELIATISQDQEKYKPGAVELFAQASGVSVATFYKARALFEQYTEDEFKVLSTSQGPNKVRLNWSHVISLLSVSDKKARLNFQNKAIEHGWTAEQLHAAIQEKYGNRREGSGRQFAQPKTVMQGVVNFCEFTGELLKRVDQVWNLTINELAELPPEQFTVDSHTRLQALILLQGRAIEAYTEQKAKSERALMLMETSLNSRNLHLESQ